MILNAGIPGRDVSSEGRPEPGHAGLGVDRSSLVLQATKGDTQLGIAVRQQLIERRRLGVRVDGADLETVHVGHLF